MANIDIGGRIAALRERASRLTRKQWLWIGGGTLVALLVLRFLFGGSTAVEYLTKPVTHGDLALTVSATGTLAPRDQVDVGAEVSGKIDALYVDFNDHVKKGEKLARINTENFEAALAQSRAALSQAVATLVQASQTRTRVAALMRANAASRQELDSANADLARADAGVKLARAQVNANATTLAKATIYSPINGVVLDRKVSAGQTVVAAMTTPVLFTLASDLSQMELDVDIDEADVGVLRAGTSAWFTVDAYPSRRFAAKLISIHNAPKTVQGVVTYQGVLIVENREGLLKPGMTATADLAASVIHNADLVPNAALRFVPSDDVKAKAPSAPAPQAGIMWGRVWVKSGGSLVPRDIQLGATDGNSTVILKGNLKPGDEVVTEIKGHPWQSKPSSPFGG
ncbi:MAG: efflux RND transporter periplasmic adaptor subunit [Proteobacteria bacterium]|nr:efflux RND transporter periplasmic adaptor subunit [Pseudomonadota bacterium]